MRVIIYGLLYGGYPKLHARCVNSILEGVRHCPVGHEVDVFFWCNKVSEKTFQRLKRVEAPYGTYDNKNVPKYTAMRNHIFKLRNPKDYDWMVWFDDDSWVTHPKTWLKHAFEFIKNKERENVCYFGEPWLWAWRPGQWTAVQQAAWFKGKPAQKIGRRQDPGVKFAQGGCWWLRTDVQQLLDWPDSRLVHNGGDTLLAEAVRQQNLLFHTFKHGFKSNDHPRRGLNTKPLGQY